MVPNSDEPVAAAEAAAAAASRVEGWIAAARAGSGRAEAPDLLEGARSDADGFAFARRLLETIVAVNDPFTAALGLRAASQDLPDSLPARDRIAMRAGGVASLGLPWAVLPVARRWLRDRVSHLVLSARIPASGESRSAGITALLDKYSAAGMQTLLCLEGEAVLGPRGVEREVTRLVGLVRQAGVASIGVDPARISPSPATAAGAAGAWSLDADAGGALAALAPLLDAAYEQSTAILLEPRDYRGALLAARVATLLLADPSRAGIRLGVRLPAELPESHPAAERLIAAARERAASCGAPLELTVGAVGLTDGERIASLLDGLAVPALEGRESVAAQLLRLAESALAAGDAVNVVVETEDPLLLAAATLAAERLGAHITLQLRAGTAPVLAAALVEHGMAVRLRQPLVPSKEFSGCIGTLVGLAADAAEPGGALDRASAFALAVERTGDNVSEAVTAFEAGSALAEARDELARVIAQARDPFPPSHRTQQRVREWNPTERDSAVFYRPPADDERFDTGGLTAAVLGLGRDATGQIVVEADGPALRVPVVSESGFAAEPDTDATKADNREWARGLLERAAAVRALPSRQDPAPDPSHADSGMYEDAERREALLASCSAAAEAWGAQRAVARGTRVARLALAAASARDRLIEVLAVETGAPVAVLDAEVSGVVDAARYLGQLAPGLGAVRGAEFQPDGLALVAVDAGVPLAERAEAVLAALAAGSAALLVVHPSAARSCTALIEEWEAAGLPAGAISLAVGDAEVAGALAADARVSRALVLGGRETARVIIRRRPALQVEGRFRALGSTLIAPSAEPADAVRATVRSAFGAGAGDARSARALVLLGSASRSKRLRRLLADAVRGLRVGDSAAPGEQDPLTFDVGPLHEPPGEAGLRALTELQGGEEWLVEPERLDEAGLLWRPGVRLGVRRDARFWADAVGMPVIGVVTAGSLDQALALQNELGGGGVAALHSTDPSETLPWLDGAQAAALSVGRATTAARVEHQPVGGWGAAGMGASPLAGGPNRLVSLGSWLLREGTASSTLHLRGLDPEVQVLVETAQASLDYAGFDRVRRAVLADALAWRTSLGRVRDTVGLGIERNLLRHWPVSTHVRLAEGGSLAGLVRVLAAGTLVGSPMTVSTGEVLPAGVARFLAEQGIAVSLERDDAWLERIAVAGSGENPIEGALAERVRLIGGDAVRAAEWLGGQDRVPLRAEPVTMAGPVELLAFLREQSVSIAAHRHGFAAPVAGVDEWAAELDSRATPVG